MVAGLTPRDKNKDFKDLQDEVMRLRDSVRFTSPTVNASDSTGFGFGSKTQEVPPIGGLFALEPQIIEVALELEYTGGIGELVTGDLVTSSVNAWEGKFVEWIDGNDIAGRAVFTPQNTTAFSDTTPQTLSVSGGWSASYTLGTVKQNRLPLQSSSIVVDDINANFEVQTITGTINNGQFLILKPIDTKTLTLKTGGNIDITSDVSISDNEIAILQFHEDNITPDPNGNYNVLVTDGGGAPPASVVIAWKEPCRIATTANITLSGNQTIDGILTVDGDRVLVKDQTTGSENGIYVADSGAWTRATDFDENSEVIAGATTYIEEGNVNANAVYKLITINPITVGSTTLTFRTVINMATDDINNVDRLLFSDTGNTGVPISATDHVIFLDPTDDMTFNSPSVDKFQWSFLNQIGAILSWENGTPPTGNPQLELVTTDSSTAVPRFLFFKDTPTIVTGAAGTIQFFKNAAGPVQANLVDLVGVLSNATSAFEGSFEIDIAEGGTTPVKYMSFNEQDIFNPTVPTNNIRVFRDINMDTNDINFVDRLTFQKTGNTGAPVSNIDAVIFLDSTDDMTFNLGNVDKFQWSFQLVNALTLERAPVADPNFGPVLQFNSPSVLIPTFRLIQTNPAPIAGLATGNIEFFANRLDLSTVDVGGITAALRDTTTSHEGQIEFTVAELGAVPSSYIILNSPFSPNQVRILRDIDMNSPFSPGVITNVGNIRSDIFTVVNSGAGSNVLITSNFSTLSASILGDWLPTADDTHDLGKTPSNAWRDLHLDGIANINTLNIGGADDSTQHVMFGFMTIADKITPPDPISAATVQLFLDDSTGELSVRKFGSQTVSLETGAVAGGGDGAGLTFASVVKSVDEIVNNSTVNQPDNELLFNANANKTYHLTLIIYLQSPGTADFKSDWTLPAGATGDILDGSWQAASSTGNTINITNSVNRITGGLVERLEWHGRIVVGSTGGLCNFRWAQDTAVVTDTKVLKGSTLRVYEEGAVGGGSITDASAFAKVVKEVDEIVNNSAVKQNDDELFFVGTANKVYSFQMYVMVDLNTAIQVQWGLPAGATGEWNALDWTSGGSSQTQSVTDDIFVSSTGGNIEWVPYAGRIQMGSTTGICNFQWAQNSATAVDTTILRGSVLIVWEEGSTGAGTTAGIIITPTLENISPAANENVDLSLFQHFIFQLSANITITLINPPPTANNAEQFILEFIQDATGGRTLSVTNTINPSVPVLDGTALSRTVIVGFVVNDIGGNKRFDMYKVGS